MCECVCGKYMSTHMRTHVDGWPGGPSRSSDLSLSLFLTLSHSLSLSLSLSLIVRHTSCYTTQKHQNPHMHLHAYTHARIHVHADMQMRIARPRTCKYILKKTLRSILVLILWHACDAHTRTIPCTAVTHSQRKRAPPASCTASRR